MSKVIRFKVKTLIKGLIVLLVLSGVSYSLLLGIMFKITDGHIRKNNTEMAMVYLDRINRYFPKYMDLEKLELAAKLSTKKNQYIEVTANSFGNFGRGVIKGKYTEEELAYYQRLSQDLPNTPQGKRAQGNIFMHQIAKLLEEEKHQEAMDLYNGYLEQTNEADLLLYDLTELLTNRLRGKGYRHESIQIVEAYLGKYPNYNIHQMYEILGDLYKSLNRREDAIKYYTKAIEVLEEYKRRMGIPQETVMEGESDWKTQQIDHLNYKLARSEIIDEGGKITGVITKNGKPLAGVEIMLQPVIEDERGGSVSYSHNSSDLWQTSNEKGEFDFSYLNQGKYNLGFVMNSRDLKGFTLVGGRFPHSLIEVTGNEEHHWEFDLIETIEVIYPLNGGLLEGDKIPFQWVEVEDASYYTLEVGLYFQIGGSVMHSLQDPIYNNRINLPIGKLQELGGGYKYDEDGVVPDSFFGYSNPNATYYWGVNAHDEDGNIITSSIGYIKEQVTDFKLKPRELRQGDRFLLDREIQKAIEAYEEDLLKNPYDSYALNILVRIYQFSDKDYPYTNKEKVEEYQERLKNLN